MLTKEKAMNILKQIPLKALLIGAGHLASKASPKHGEAIKAVISILSLKL